MTDINCNKVDDKKVPLSLASALLIIEKWDTKQLKCIERFDTQHEHMWHMCSLAVL